jgi:hypothetical protein
MEIRIKTTDGKQHALPGKKRTLNEFDFWKSFLKTLDLEAKMSDPELKIMAFILSGSPYKSYFKKPAVNKLLEFMGFKHYQNLWKYRKTLIDLNLLEFTGEVRGDFLPGKNLRNLQIFLKEKIKKNELEEIELVIPIKIKNTDHDS